MSIGKDGALDKHGEVLPELSKHASILEYEKLLKVFYRLQISQDYYLID